MNIIRNTQKVKCIYMHPKAECKCVLGKDWYHIDFDVIFKPSDYYPDYTEVENFIMNNIDGHALNIEDAIQILYGMLSETFEPNDLTVTAKIKNSKTHFDVEVEI